MDNAERVRNYYASHPDARRHQLDLNAARGRAWRALASRHWQEFVALMADEGWTYDDDVPLDGERGRPRSWFR